MKIRIANSITEGINITEGFQNKSFCPQLYFINFCPLNTEINSRKSNHGALCLELVKHRQF